MTVAASRLPVTVVSAAVDVWGTERSILALAPHLHERGIDLTIACPEGEFEALARDAGLSTRRLVLPPRGGERTSPLRDLARDAAGVPRGVARIIATTHGAAVVHSNNLLTHPDTAVAGRLSRRPTVLELHDIVAPGAPALLLSGAAALASAVASISRATAEPIRGPGNRRLVALPQAVDLDRFTPGPSEQRWRGLVDAPFVVGVVGRVDPSKGVETVLRAVDRAGPDIGLLVVGGRGWDAGDHLEQMRALGDRLLGARFHHAGTTPDVPQLLRSLDVLVNASDAEPFGLSVLEAQACGTPVVGTAAGGIPDFVDDGRTGLLVAPRDPAALAGALRRLADDAALRDRLAAQALQTAREHHGIAARAARLADIYRSVSR